MTEREIFLAVLDLPDSADVATYLDEACGGDSALRARVETLLRSHEIAGSFLKSPAVENSLPTSAPNKRVSNDATLDEDCTSDCDTFTFLSPSTRPDSLGRIGHYEVLEVLGQGGFGIVFRAFDEVLQRVVAVKVLAPALATTSPPRKRFLREARSSAAVRHENVVHVYAVEEQPLPYLVMEFIPGESIQQRIDRTGPLEIPEVVQLGRQIAEGLAAAHAQVLIHRDIKPGNILVEAGTQPRAKISDFGLARAADDASLSASGLLAGTPRFMSPEQAKGETLDHRTDLFSLGSVLYTMVTGRPPFRANGTLAVLKRVVEDTPRSIREIIPETPQWLCDIISKLHAKKPEDRFQSAAEVAHLLARDSTESSWTVLAAKPPARRRRKQAVAAGTMMCLAIAGLGIYAATRSLQNAADNGQMPALLNPRAAESARTGRPGIQNGDADRIAAAYVLALGGQVRINDGAINNLPEEPFLLTYVYLRDNPRVRDQGLVLFQNCKHVKHLDLANTQVSDAGLLCFKNCNDMEHLDLYHTNVSDTGLAGFQGCMRLKYLDLRDTRVSDVTLAGFKNCRNVKYLDLANTQVSDAGLAYFKNCKRLEHLDLFHTNVGDTGLANLQGCPGLKWLDLRDTQTSNAGFAFFTNCNQLEHLGLGNTQVSDPALADLKDCKNLEYLDLFQTSVSDPGLASFHGCTQLRWLDLRSTRVSDTGLANFRNCDHLEPPQSGSNTRQSCRLAVFQHMHDFEGTRSGRGQCQRCGAGCFQRLQESGVS